jgi:tRNA(fMet)-specific endonuclease VapC
VPVLDTDILSIIQRRTEPAYTRLLRRLQQLPPDEIVWVTVISFEEQLRGWLEYLKRAAPDRLPIAYAKLHELNQDFSTRPVLPFDAKAADEYTRVLRMRTRVATMDLRIAAICIARDELLISQNLRDFHRVPNLKVENWAR